MRLAFISTSYPVADLPIDGIGKAFSLIAGAAAPEHDVSVIVANERFEQPVTYHDGQVVIHAVPAPKTVASRACGRLGMWNVAARLRLASAVRRAVRELGPFDVIESSSWFGLHAFLMLRRKGALPKIVTLLVTPARVAMASSPGHDSWEMRLADRFDQFATRRSDALIADSELHRRHLGAIRWIAADSNVSVIPLPAQLPPEDAAAAPREAHEVLQVGVFDERKRQDLSVRALARLAPEFPGLHLVLVGLDTGADDGTCSKRVLQCLSTTLGIDVWFLSRLTEEELRERYHRAAVVLQPSDYESFGLPVAEAMASGRPVVTTATTGASEWITEVSGTVIARANVSALTAAIRPYLSDRSRRIEAGRAARLIAERELVPERVWEKRLDLYRSLLARSSDGS